MIDEEVKQAYNSIQVIRTQNLSRATTDSIITRARERNTTPF